MKVVLMFFLCVMSLGLTQVTFGSDLKPTLEAESDFTTDYNISNYSLSAKTKTQKIFKGSFAITFGYPFDSMVEHLESFPFIMDITRHLSKEFEPEKKTWNSYLEHKRESIVFIKLALSKPVIIMMSLEEGYEECVSAPAESSSSGYDDYDDYDEHGGGGYSSSSYYSSCYPKSRFKLNGPIKVYSESLVDSGDIKNLLKDQIEIKSNFSRSSDGELVVDTSMNRPNKFLDLTYDALNKLQIPWNGSRKGSYQPMSGRGYMNESQISLNIVRFFRLANERVLNQITNDDKGEGGKK